MRDSPTRKLLILPLSLQTTRRCLPLKLYMWFHFVPCRLGLHLSIWICRWDEHDFKTAHSSLPWAERYPFTSASQAWPKLLLRALNQYFNTMLCSWNHCPKIFWWTRTHYLVHFISLAFVQIWDCDSLNRSKLEIYLYKEIHCLADW